MGFLMNTGPNIAPDQPSRRSSCSLRQQNFPLYLEKCFFELRALLPVIFLHTAWLTKPIPEVRAEQNLLGELPYGIRAMGVKKVPEGKTGTLQTANFYLPSV